MKRTQDNLTLLNVVFITSLIISNIVGVKVVSLFGLTVTGAAGCYAITFLCTDIINEIWGRGEANRTVRNGFICQAFACLMIVVAGWLPYAPYNAELKQSFDAILSQNFRFVCASMLAYLASQMWDVHIFQVLKGKSRGKNRWIRNNLSTMTSQLIDTAIFITIAFYGVVENLPVMIIGQYILKFVLALLDTPFFYLFTRRRLEYEHR